MKNTHKLYTDVIAKSGSKNEPLEVTVNGTYEAPKGTGYSPVMVNVPQIAESGTLKALLDATKSAYYLFNRYQGKTVDDLISYNDTANVTDMAHMFNGCYELTTIPELYTSNVTDMSYMLYWCISLTTIPQLDTSKVTNMVNMFYYCTELTSIPRLDASKVTNMSYMFDGCGKLEEIHMTGMKANFNISASTLFTRDALLEILNNLATVDSTKTLTMGSTNLAKLTDEDKAIATNKGWTLA